MRKIARWVGLVLLAAGAPVAAEPQWETVDAARGRTVFFDCGSAVREKGYARAWERADFAETQPADRTGERFQSMKSLYRYDCAGRSATPRCGPIFPSKRVAKPCCLTSRSTGTPCCRLSAAITPTWGR